MLLLLSTQTPGPVTEDPRAHNRRFSAVAFLAPEEHYLNFGGPARVRIDAADARWLTECCAGLSLYSRSEIWLLRLLETVRGFDD